MKNIVAIKNMKGTEQVCFVTAYDCFTARYADEAGVDGILVGDSVGMTHLGMPDTSHVRTPHILHHLRAVTSRPRNALVVADMPFLSVDLGVYRAIETAAEFMLSGAGAVKVEGGASRKETVSALIDAGIPVMGHLGLLPQRVHATGGYRCRNRSQEEKERIVRDAILLESLGVFSLVLECVDRQTAQEIRRRISVPVIGIGSGTGLDGQILVANDILGIEEEHAPAFATQYAGVGQIMQEAFGAYVKDVKADENR